MVRTAGTSYLVGAELCGVSCWWCHSPLVSAGCVSSAKIKYSRSHLGVVFAGGKRSKDAGVQDSFEVCRCFATDIGKSGRHGVTCR